MAPPQTRRQFFSTLSLAGATALFGVCPTALADEPPETRTIRFAKNASICVFPQFYLQETLRAEGFSEIGYIEASAVRTLEPIARGTADFAVSFGLGQIIEIDAGSPITILGGVHVGCYELFARENIRSVPELKGKSVGLETASPALLKLMAANVGLDPEKDFDWVTDRKLKPLELFAAGKIDAFLGFPPEPQELHERRVGHVVLSTTADRPWSDYYCCMLAGNADFIRTHPVAAKRVLRAVLKNTDLCATNPAEAARRLVEGGFTPRYDFAFDAGRAQGSCIQNVPGRGYGFVAPVRRVDLAVPASALPLGKARGENETPPALGVVGDIGRGSPPRARKRQWSWRGVTVAAAGVLGIAVSAITAANWHVPWRADGNQAPRLSIVVLPFTNLNDDREQQYFVDGITDELTTALSRPPMFVISRSTAFTYKDKRADARQIGRELGVRYLLDGSVRRSGDRVRVNAQLIATETGANLEAVQLDHDVRDLISLQSEIAGSIANVLGARLVKAEAARPAEHPDVLDRILRGRAVWFNPPTPENYAKVIGWLDQALALDPHSLSAQSWLAIALIARVQDRMSDSPRRDIDRAEFLSTLALETSPNSPLANYAKGQVLRAQKRCEDAILEFEEVLALDPNWANALHGLSVCKLLTESIGEAIPLEERAIRISPRDSRISIWYAQIGLVHLLQSRTEEAIVWLKKARNAAPGRPYVPAYLASAYAIKGESELAAAALAEAQRLNPDGLYSSIASVKARYQTPAPSVAALYESTFYAGLRRAGVPEQ